MQWQPLSNIEILKRLEIPAADSGKVLDMVLDTDTYNEVDDQFALCYALCSPEHLNVQAVYAAPFFNDRSNGPEQGMERSYDEIVRLLGKMGHPTENFVFKGSRDYLKDMDTPQDSPAARDLVARGMARPDDDPLYATGNRRDNQRCQRADNGTPPCAQDNRGMAGRQFAHVSAYARV